VPFVVVAVSVACALEKDCEDELELADEALLEEGARMIWKLRWKSKAKSAATSKAASAAPTPGANARGSPWEDKRGTCETWGVGQTAPRC
jgi:hypothetical protein